MRTLIKGYTFTAGTRSIDCSNCNSFDIENIRLIVNETQKVVICSSMQKDLIVSIIDGVITYADTLPVLSDGDKLTIEIDYSYMMITSGHMYRGFLSTNEKSFMEILTNGNFESVPFQIDDNVIETISRQYAFAGMKDLTAVSMSNVKTIVSYTFQSCTNLTTVSLPAAQTIGERAFYSCTNLTSVSLPVAQTIGVNAFNSCTNLTTVTLPAAQTIEGGAFTSCPNLTTVTLPAAQTIGGAAFYNCTNITTLTFGKLTSFVSGSTLTNCPRLSNIIIGAGTNINLDFSTLSSATWNNNVDASVWNENFVSGIINNLFDFTSGAAHTIKLGAYPYAKLTPETIALAAAKNWNITA